jgi:phosphotransferase system enzyme I (PtsI)
MIILDGNSGDVLISPTQDILDLYYRKLKQYEQDKEQLTALKGKATVTQSGQAVRLYANIGGVKDAQEAIESDAEGVGLFRTEFLYLEHLPGEDEQTHIYRHILRILSGRPLIVRTMDLGADKLPSYFPTHDEKNPSLGLRGIRFCLANPDIFKTQLRALFRASADGQIGIMFPMITSLQELIEAKRLVGRAQSELASEHIAYDKETKIGVMIETPSAALISDALAQEADFFSIGTNDLTQYTLAADRENGAVRHIYNPCHPAVLDLMDMTIKNAHKHNIWVGICGEMAADKTMLRRFLEWRVDELSVSPSHVLDIRGKIRALVD